MKNPCVFLALVLDENYARNNIDICVCFDCVCCTLGGKFEWSGDYSDSSALWTELLLREVEGLVRDHKETTKNSPSSIYKIESKTQSQILGLSTGGADGSFWMGYSDFVQYLLLR